MDQLGKALIVIERANLDCRVSLESFGHIWETGTKPGAGAQAAVLVYSVEGCGGGNNWGFQVSVQKVTDKGLAPLRGLKEHAFANVHGVRFSDDAAVFDVETYADEDAHCCPSIRRTATVSFEAGAAKIAFSNLRRVGQDGR